MQIKNQLVVFASALALSCALQANAQATPQAISPSAGDEANPDNATRDVVVVTGTSIEGIAPVGSNLSVVSRDDLEDTGAQTVQQVLKSVPSIVGMLSAGQGSYGSFDGAGTNAPTIHGLGASASNSTLILINGHRLPVSGINHVLADPNIIAPLALERVEVLGDGASSVYGSDAVAGVVNFITRRDYDGLEVSVQKGFGDAYGAFNAGVLAGTSWDAGSALVSYSYSDRGNVAAADRDFARADQRARGGRNFTPNRCSPASITIGTSTYYTPYAAAGAVAGDCDPSKYWDLIPSEVRHSVLVSLSQDINDQLSVTGDFIYSNRDNKQTVSRGSATGTIYGPGSTPPAGFSINPFYRTIVGGTATSETINFNADQLLGPGANIKGTAETIYFRGDADYALSDSWSLNAGLMVGVDTASQVNDRQLCASCFNLALNGRAAATLNGTTQVVTQTLTAANAVDVFGSGTSAATLAQLADSRQLQIGDQTIQNYYAKLSGDLFELPGGVAKVAVGAELIDYDLKQDIVRANGLGAASTNSSATHIDYNRDVQSAYVEVYLPLVRDTLIRSLDVTLSGRVDDYSDFGSTTNPKIAANLEVFDGFMLRGNWGESFVAPALTSRGANQFGLTGESGFSGVSGQGLPGGAPNILVANFPNAIGIPGCATGATTCSLNNVTGLLITGGNGNLKPQTGEAFSVGLDWTPSMAPGLQVSATYWDNKLRGGITAPQPALALGAADLSYLLQVFPAGATPAQIATATQGLPQAAPLNPTTYFIYNFQQQNVLNLDVAGVDVSASYEHETSIGDFDYALSFTKKTRFNQFFGATGQKFSVLGTAGFNTTFPSVEWEGRASVGFSHGPLDAKVFYNYLGGYQNWSGSVATPLVRTNGVPTGGGDAVDAFQTIDLNLAYAFENVALLRELEVFLDASNLLDEEPPQYNTFVTNGAAGYDNINASPIGRVVTLGARAKF